MINVNTKTVCRVADIKWFKVINKETSTSFDINKVCSTTRFTKPYFTCSQCVYVPIVWNGV